MVVKAGCAVGHGDIVRSQEQAITLEFRFTKLAANFKVSTTLLSKYGHSWLQKAKMATLKMQT